MNNEMTQQERLAVCLWLAKWCGLWSPHIVGDAVALAHEKGSDMPRFFDPFTNPAQRMELVERAAMNGLGPTLEDTYCAAFDSEVRQYKIPHNNTPAGVRAATLEAIALATGFDGDSHEAR